MLFVVSVGLMRFVVSVVSCCLLFLWWQICCGGPQSCYRTQPHHEARRRETSTPLPSSCSRFTADGGLTGTSHSPQKVGASYRLWMRGGCRELWLRTCLHSCVQTERCQIRMYCLSCVCPSLRCVHENGGRLHGHTHTHTRTHARARGKAKNSSATKPF